MGKLRPTEGKCPVQSHTTVICRTLEQSLSLLAPVWFSFYLAWKIFRPHRLKRDYCSWTLNPFWIAGSRLLSHQANLKKISYGCSEKDALLCKEAGIRSCMKNKATASFYASLGGSQPPVQPQMVGLLGSSPWGIGPAFCFLRDGFLWYWCRFWLFPGMSVCWDKLSSLNGGPAHLGKECQSQGPWPSEISWNPLKAWEAQQGPESVPWRTGKHWGQKNPKFR